MKLFDSIDGLFSATRYLVWGLGVLGIIGSAVLIFVNILFLPTIRFGAINKVLFLI